MLLYLTSWYWAWIEYQLVFVTYNVTDANIQLQNAIKIVTKSIEADSTYSHIDEVKLNKIIVNEYSKSYLTKEVDLENKDGYFVVYKRLISRIKELIMNINQDYLYASSLASTIVEGALHQHFLRVHFKSITDCNDSVTPTDFFTDLVFKAINK